MAWTDIEGKFSVLISTVMFFFSSCTSVQNIHMNLSFDKRQVDQQLRQQEKNNKCCVKAPQNKTCSNESGITNEEMAYINTICATV